MARIKSPLSEEVHLPMLRENLAYIEEAMQHVATAKRAGVDVSKYEDQLKDARDKTLAIKNAYFPGK